MQLSALLVEHYKRLNSACCFTLKLQLKVHSKMTLYKFSWVVLHCWIISLLLFKAHGDGSGVSVKFFETPDSTSRLNSATFKFNVSMGEEPPPGGNGPCKGYNISCKLDNGNTTNCGVKKVSYTGLQDGNHTFEVCGVGSAGVGCSFYDWTVDTVPPTAHITSSDSFTNAMNVSVYISFTEPCTGEDGKEAFTCSSENACNLLVHGDGQVIPSSLVTLVPKRKYTLLVGFSSEVENGTVALVMDNNFCSDTAGNKFIRAENSSVSVSFDRTSVLVNLSSPVPEKFLPLDSGNMTLLATNNHEDLTLCLNFSEPILNSSAQVLNSLNTSPGKLLPIGGENTGNCTFSFKVVNVPSFAIINIPFDSKSIRTRFGNPVSPIQPVNFLYDSRRPQVSLITISRRTSQRTIPIWIEFLKPVLGYNKSSISILGGRLLSFEEINKSTMYFIMIHADADFVSVTVPENVTEDVFGNTNQAADALQVRHYSMPIISRTPHVFVTPTVWITYTGVGVLTLSTASLVSAGALSGQSSSYGRNLFRSIGHIQLIALSRWLTVKLPIEYYEFARALQWSIPYFNLPWENGRVPNVDLKNSQNVQPKEVNLDKAVNVVLRSRQTNSEDYEKAFGSDTLKAARAQYLDSQDSDDGWRDFKRSMFWLAVIGGSLILLHATLVLILKFRRRNSQIQYRVFTSPRFEIFLIILALPCICKASTGLVRGGERSGVIVGSLLLGVVCFLLLSFFLFLFVGVTLGMLLHYHEDNHIHYNEDDHEDQEFHWYQSIIRVTLGPSKRGKWKMKNQSNHDYLITILGPLFEDLRGAPRYVLSKISKEKPQNQDDCSIVSDDETEDAEPNEANPSNHSDHIIAPDDVIEDGEVSGENSHMLGDRIVDSTCETGDTRSPEGNPHEHGDCIIAIDDETEGVEASTSNPHQNDDRVIACNDRTSDAREPEDNPHEPGDRIIVSDDETEDIEAPGGNPEENGGLIIVADDETEDIEAPGGNPEENGDHIIVSDDAIEVVESPGENPHINGDLVIASDDKRGNAEAPEDNPHKHDDRIIASEEKTENVSIIQKLFGSVRTYYTLLESVRQVTLGTLAGAYSVDNSSKSPTIILLSITCLQLLFLLLLKPLVTKVVQLVEMITIACEVGTLSLCLLNLEKEFSAGKESKVGICMVILSLIGYLAQMSNEGYALYIQTKNLDQHKKSFVRGLRKAWLGFVLFFLPEKRMQILKEKFEEIKAAGGGIWEAGSSADGNRSKEAGEAARS